MAVAVPAPDPAAQRAALLFERHHAAILAYCSWRLRTRFDAEEAAQTTFARALSALRRGQSPRNERAWLVTIARNVCTTLGTAPHRALEVAGDVPHRIEHETDDGLGPELESALAALPEGQRRALLLREWHELSYREIAAELGVSVGTVESWIFRARRSLASALGGARRHLGLASLLRSIGPSAGAKVAATTVLAAAVVATERAVDMRSAHQPTKRPAPLPAQARVVDDGAPARAASAGRRISAQPRTERSSPARPGAVAPTVDSARSLATDKQAAGAAPAPTSTTTKPTPTLTTQPEPAAPSPTTQPEPAPSLPAVEAPALPVPEPQLPPVQAPAVPDVPLPDPPPLPVEVPELPATPDLPVEAPTLP